jgi:hypothetical protein
MKTKEFMDIKECCWMNDKLDKCYGRTVKDSFFCGKHKHLLFKINDFVLLHSGNKKKILEDMKIKTAKEAGVNGTGKILIKHKFEQVFTQLLCPNFHQYIYGYHETKTQGIKKGYGGYVFIKPSILKDLSEKDKKVEIHLSSNCAAGGDFYDDPTHGISIKYDRDYSLRENLNRMYNFYVFAEYKNCMIKWKRSNKQKSIDDIKKEVFESDTCNELVFNTSVPLIINNKQYYIEDSSKLEELYMAE